MDKTTLETFIAICEYASFSKAADKLHLTQPAISKRLNTLENKFNMQLIDRLGKTASPTQSGEVLLRHAKQLLLLMDECETAVNNLDTSISGTLHLGISHHIALHRLPVILQRFSTTYPEVKLDLQFISSTEALPKIQKAELELALATLPTTPSDNSQASYLTIWQDPLCIAVKSDHTLARLNDERSLNTNDLFDYTALLPNTHDATRQIIDQTLNLPAKHHIIEANTFEGIRMLTRIGLGFSVLPRTLLDKTLRALTLNIKTPKRQLGVIHHQSRTLSNASRAFLRVLENHSA